MINSKKPSVVNVQRLRQPIKLLIPHISAQPMRILKISDRNTPGQADLASTATEFNKTTIRQTITPNLKVSKERAYLPKSSQTSSTVTGSPQCQIQGQSIDTQNQATSQDFELSNPQLQNSNIDRLISPTDSDFKIDRPGTELETVGEFLNDQRYQSVSPTQEQMQRVRGTFQRENVSSEEKAKLLEQKRKMKEVLDLQIEEKQKKQQREKELERERYQQDEERIKKQIEEESRQLEEQQKLKKAEIQTAPHRGIKSPSPSLANLQLIRSLSKDSYKSGQRQQNLMTENLPEFEKVPIIKQLPTINSSNHQEIMQNQQTLNQVQSAQGFYLQSEYIEFLKQQNEDLKAENDKKDQLIQGLIGTKPRIYPLRNSVGTVNQNINKKSFLKLDSSPNQIANIPNSPPQTSSMSVNHLSKSQSSKHLKSLPKSQQEKKQHFQRLPQITTPQPQLSHLKTHNPQSDENIMDLFPISKEKQDKDTFLCRKKQFITRDEETNWSFGKTETCLPIVQSQNEPSTFSKKRFVIPQKQVTPDNLKESIQLNEFQSKLLSLENHQSLLPTHAIKKTNINLQRPPSLIMQFLPTELPCQSTFLKSENNHVNPEFTFSNSIADHFMDQIQNNFGYSRKVKDKLPKEFQIVPQKRKFFI